MRLICGCSTIFAARKWWVPGVELCAEMSMWCWLCAEAVLSDRASALQAWVEGVLGKYPVRCHDFDCQGCV